MSFAALAMVLGHAAMFGVVHEADEGTAAHIFQLLIWTGADRGILRHRVVTADSKASAAGTGATRWRRARSVCRRLLSHLSRGWLASIHESVLHPTTQLLLSYEALPIHSAAGKEGVAAEPF